MTNSKESDDEIMPAASSAEPAAASSHDLILRNGTIIDGTGSPAFRGDIAVAGNRIVRIGNLTGITAQQVLDVTGFIVAPGFIDAHTHAATGLVREGLGHARPLLAQGVTLIIANPDGSGPVDLEAQRQQLETNRPGIHVAQLVPHGSIRRQVMGTENRPATPAELEQMKALVREAMEYGAYGLSTGIFYVPGIFAPTEEYIALCQIVAEYGGVHQSHIRDESDYSIGVIAAVEELIAISRASGVTGVVTHIKALGTPVWGTSETIIQHINEARYEGLSIYSDQYPYTASASSIMAALVPAWAREGGNDVLRERLADPVHQDSIIQGITQNLIRRGGPDRILYRMFAEDRTVEGRTLAEVAEERQQQPEIIILEQIKKGNPSIASFNMDENDIRAFMQQPWNMTSSDGGYVAFGIGTPHPRSYGSFPRKIRKYVYEDSLLTLEKAVRSMTSLTAGVYGIQDRGLLRQGMVADIVVFDPETLTDRATYQQPHQYSEGMVHVIVNGRLAIKDRIFTDVRHGEVLRR